METLLDRATRVARHHPAPALPLDELRRLVRGSGVVVREEALLRALARKKDRFRVVDPWRGPWTELRPPVGTPADVAGSDPAGERVALSRSFGQPWVVVRPRKTDEEDGSAVLRRLRWTVAHLGWEVDDRSVRDMTRWCRLLNEADRVRRRTRRSPGRERTA